MVVQRVWTIVVGVMDGPAPAVTFSVVATMEVVLSEKVMTNPMGKNMKRSGDCLFIHI